MLLLTLVLAGVRAAAHRFPSVAPPLRGTSGSPPSFTNTPLHNQSQPQVRSPPRIETPEERRHYATLQARMMAFESKMGTGSGVRSGRARR